MTELWQLGAAETAAAIADKKSSARDAVDAHLARLDAINPTLNAVTVARHDAARAEADAADKAVASGAQLGPLHGVPVTVKDNQDMAGYASTNGVVAFKDTLAKEDAATVVNLRAAGAIIIGRTNTPEFSLRWHAANPVYGATINPWNAALTPGGSSGGAAAGIAMGIGCLAHGTDLGGSVRYPAYCNGIMALKTTPGRVPSYNPSAPAERPHITQSIAIHGPIARSVADLRVGLEALAQPNAGDPAFVPMPLTGPRLDTPIRVAVTTDPCGDGVDASVSAAVTQAADILANAGYAVEAVDPPAVAEIADAWAAVIWNEVNELMMPAIREYGSEEINRILGWCVDKVPAMNLNAYAAMTADRNRLRRLWEEFLQTYPLVLAPNSFRPPFAAGMDAESVDNLMIQAAAQRMQTAINYINLPAVAAPTGLHDGAPMGVQIIGRQWREDTCLDAAEVLEREVGMLCRQLWEV